MEEVLIKRSKKKKRNVDGFSFWQRTSRTCTTHPSFSLRQQGEARISKKNGAKVFRTGNHGELGARIDSIKKK